MNYVQEDFLDLSDSAVLKARGISVVSYKHIDSTSLAARRYAAKKPSLPLLIIADFQSEGRGRMGRSFFSPEGTGLYATLLLDASDCPISSVVGITSAAAVAVSLAIENVTGIECGIKWVNDIYLRGKKIAGILTEAFAEGDSRFLSIGVGINVCTDNFPKELMKTAASIGADESVRRELALEVCLSIFEAYEKIKRGDASFMEEYRKRSVIIGKEISFFENGRQLDGVAEYVDDEGGLRVVLKDGEKKVLRSGEITLKIK